MSETRVIENELLVEKKDDLLVLTLNRPFAANSLSPTLVEALLTEVNNAQDIRLCVIKGNGRHFCAGFDLSDIESLSDGDILWRILRIEHLIQAIHHAPFPTLALAHNQAVGAGADLFAACYQRVAAPNTRFKMPGWNFELALGTRRLCNLIGTDAARNFLIDTKSITAKQSLKWKLSTEIAEINQWDDIINDLLIESRALPKVALRNMLNLTVNDTRQSDLAAIVQTAGQPGLKQKILAYRQKVLSRTGNKKRI